jgi:hypothetical protein
VQPSTCQFGVHDVWLNFLSCCCRGSTWQELGATCQRLCRLVGATTHATSILYVSEEALQQLCCAVCVGSDFL